MSAARARATADRAGVRRNAVRCRAAVGGVFKGRACVAPATLRLNDVSKKSRHVGKWAIIAINSRNESSSFLLGFLVNF